MRRRQQAVQVRRQIPLRDIWIDSRLPNGGLDRPLQRRVGVQHDRGIGDTEDEGDERRRDNGKLHCRGARLVASQLGEAQKVPRFHRTRTVSVLVWVML